MGKRLVRSIKAVLCTAALFGAGVASAVDGVIEINDTSIVASGGYPFTIGASGSYVLTGNLTAPLGSGAIVVAAPSVEIDLNGFTIFGSGGGIGDGISAPVFQVTVKNGTISGFGGAGILGSSELKVLNTRIAGNGSGIAGATDCLIAGNTVVSNLGIGISAVDCKIENNIVRYNADTGIVGAERVIVHNKVADNGLGGAGGGILSPAGSTIQENVILRNLGFGISNLPGTPPAPVPAPPGVPFPPVVPGPPPNNIMKNVIDGGGGAFPNIGIFIGMGASTLISDNTVSGNGQDGIVCTNACTVRGNAVSQNNSSGLGNGGMTIGPGSTVSNNSISFNAGVGLVLDPTATWTQNALNANGAQDMTIAFPIGPPSAAAHPSSGFLNLCSGAPGPVAGFGPGACP